MSKKTLICIPSRSFSYSRTWFHYTIMVAHCVARGAHVHPYNPESTPPEVNRNLGINKMYEENCDEILYIDADQTFPQDLLFRLQAHNKEIVGVNCKRRVPPYNPVMTKDIMGRKLDYKKHPLVKMEKIGFAATLIKREVFDAMPDFVFERKILSRTSWIGEDYIFCQAARKAGFHVYCDLVLSNEIGHIAEDVKFLGE